MPLYNPPTSSSAAGVVPVGGIIMWSGAIATIPTPDWVLCDGTQNSPGPDLRDKFIVGAKQDDAGVAKTNIEGSLKATGGVTGHSHSAHGNLSHSGASIADHTGFTHSVAIDNHPDLTHAAIGAHDAVSFPALSHPDISLPSYSHPVLTIEGQTHATISQGGFTHPILTIEGMSHGTMSQGGLTHGSLSAGGITHSAHAMATGTVASATPSRWTITYANSTAHPSHPTYSINGPASHATESMNGPPSHPTFTASAPASHPTASINGPASHPTFTASAPAAHASGTVGMAGHASSTQAGGTHGGVGTHAGTTYGVHGITQPAAHGTAGTVTHSFTEDAAHTVSAHDTVSSVPNYYALAFIQRMI